MFERYTEKARRVIFFARYEASQFGSPYIETEHLLLGLLREDKTLANRFLRSHGEVESIRKHVEQRNPVRQKVSTSVDLPLSHGSKRILAFGAEESERLGQKHIGTLHLLAGMLREEECLAAELLGDRNVMLSEVRDLLVQEAEEPADTPLPGADPAAKFKLPQTVLAEIARQARTRGIATHAHFLSLIEKALHAPPVPSQDAKALRENYLNLRGRIEAEGLPCLDEPQLEREIARRKGISKEP